MSLLALFDAVASPIEDLPVGISNGPLLGSVTPPAPLAIDVPAAELSDDYFRDMDWQGFYDNLSQQEDFIGLFQKIFWNRVGNDFYMDASRNGSLVPQIEEGTLTLDAYRTLTGRRELAPDVWSQSIRLIYSVYDMNDPMANLLPIIQFVESGLLQKVNQCKNMFDRFGMSTRIEYNSMLEASEPFGWTLQEWNAIPNSRKPGIVIFAKGVLNLFEDCKVALLQTAARLGHPILQTETIDENFEGIQQPRQIRRVERAVEREFQRSVRPPRGSRARSARVRSPRQSRAPRIPNAPSVQGPLARYTAEQF